MATLSSQAINELLAKWQGGDEEGLRALLPLVYNELRRLAHHFLQRERPDHGELKEDMSVGRSDELRDEGKEEQRGFGIQHFGEDALTKGAVGWPRSFHGHFSVARADHADAEPDEIGGAGIFDGVKRDAIIAVEMPILAIAGFPKPTMGLISTVFGSEELGGTTKG